MIIRRSTDGDFESMLAIVNAAAEAYRGAIPEDRWHEPYMSHDEFAGEIDPGGVEFWVVEEIGRVAAIMGVQDKGEVVLVRHAYVAPTAQRSGLGTLLLHHLESLVDKPVLIGTWAAAGWAIRFYERNGYVLLDREVIEGLLRQYWSIPERQIETSVVLAKPGAMSQI
jgi:GNAT superfamily N-acetyltransferase